MRKVLFLLSIMFGLSASAQSFNSDNIAFSNFLKRMYTASPFEGVKIVDDYDSQYLISVVSLDKDKYTTPSILNRVAQVKAQSQANTFLNGASISMEMVIKTTENSLDSINTIVETVESIRQNSRGFSQGLEILTNFNDAASKRMVFIYFRELNEE